MTELEPWEAEIIRLETRIEELERIERAAYLALALWDADIEPGDWDRDCLVEQVSPGPYVELFCRQPRFGWDSWGHSYENFADLPAAQSHSTSEVGRSTS